MSWLSIVAFAVFVVASGSVAGSLHRVADAAERIADAAEDIEYVEEPREASA